MQFQQDKQIYSRLISEVNLYLRQNKTKNNWYGVVIYPRKSLDVADTKHYSEFFDSGRITRIYLEDLGDAASLPIGIATIKLIIENQKIAKQQAKELIARTKQQGLPKPQQQQLLDLIGTILVYKLPKIKKEELKAMFKKSDLRKTTFYQEVKEETTLESIPRLLALGLTPEQVAQGLDISVEVVRQVAQENNSGS